MSLTMPEPDAAVIARREQIAAALRAIVPVRTATPVVHVVERLDWARGGPVPGSLRHLERSPRPNSEIIAFERT